MDKYKEVNKVVYLSKLKFGIESELNIQNKLKDKQSIERAFVQKKLHRWEDFRQLKH